jgi:hypothetical protein
LILSFVSNIDREFPHGDVHLAGHRVFIAVG